MFSVSSLTPVASVAIDLTASWHLVVTTFCHHRGHRLLPGLTPGAISQTAVRVEGCRLTH